MVPDIDNFNGVDMADIASINGQDAPSGGDGEATTAPSVSLSGGGFGFITATITKSGGGTYTNPNYSATAVVGATTTVADAVFDRYLESDSSHLDGRLTFSDTNAAAGTRTLSVKAQEFGDYTQSSAGTATYDISYAQGRYVRLTNCDAAGDPFSSHFGVFEWELYSGAGASGTEYPTTNLTANDSETGITVSSGFAYGTYYTYGAFSGNTSAFWWALTGTAAQNWLQVEFEPATYSTAPVIKSMRINMFSTYHSDYFKITTSANADHSSATTVGIFPFIDTGGDQIQALGG